MRVLLDTNILIHREASRIFNEDIGILFKWLDNLRVTKCVHPSSIDEISGHSDESVVRTMLVKISNYNLLKTISPDSPEITSIRQYDITQNDIIDTNLLNEVFNSRVDYLITEDRGIHRKAKQLNIAEKVYKIDSFLEKLVSENPSLKDYKVLAVKKEYFGEINLGDSFFDSFKSDYKGFADWFNRKADDISYVCVTDDRIKAFLYVKIENQDENYSDILPVFQRKKRLKIGTFKVTSTGYKLGERFLKIIFDNALSNKVDEIYVTIFDKREEQQRLINLLVDWGFNLWGEKTTQNGKEKVFVRGFSPTFNISDPKLSYPYISRNSNYFLVPIYPEYHTDLLPDSVLNNESPADFIENEPYRNAIRKVYVSRSHYRNVSKGDLILFYRTGGIYKSVITTIGVIDSVYDNIKDENQFIELCRKRSVFSDSELKKHWNYSKNKPFVVNFLYIYTFQKRLNLARLIELGIIADTGSAPRGFTPIDVEKFNIIIKESNTDESYFVD